MLRIPIRKPGNTGIVVEASRRDALQSSISPRGAKHRSNPCREDFGARLERAQEKHGTGRRWAEFSDIHGKSPQPYPSLERGNFAELRRSVRAIVLVRQIVPPRRTSIQTPAWFLFCL